MKTNVSRANFLKMSVIAGCLFGGARAAMAAVVAIETEVRDHYDNLESLKKGIPFVSKWWEINFRGRLFIACLQQLPSFGQVRENVHAWRKNADGSFDLVWTYRGIGGLEVEIEEGKGIISVRVNGYPELKDTIIALANLRATLG